MPKDRMPTLIGSSEACQQDTSVRWPLEFRDRVEVVDPRLLRANKNLPARHQFISLAKRSKAHAVGFWLIASRCRVDRRPALRAESLQTDVSTIGGLSIFRRFAGQNHERAWMSDNDRSQWSAAHGLAVCAVANGCRSGIGFGLERHVAAVTAPIDFHDRFPGTPQVGMDDSDSPTGLIVRSGSKLGGHGTFSTRPIMPNNRTLPGLTAFSGMCHLRTKCSVGRQIREPARLVACPSPAHRPRSV